MPQYGDGKGNVIHTITISFPAGQDIPSGWVIVGAKAAIKAMEEYGIKGATYSATHRKEKREEVAKRERLKEAGEAWDRGEDTLSKYGIHFIGRKGASMSDSIKTEPAGCCPVCESFNGTEPERIIQGAFKGLYQMRCTQCGFCGPARPWAWAAVFWWNRIKMNKELRVVA